MKNKLKQIGKLSLLFGAGLTSHCLGNSPEISALIASLFGFSKDVAHGIFSLGGDILAHGVYDSSLRTIESFQGDVNRDLETAIINAYKKTLSNIENDVIADYKLKEKKSEKLTRILFNKTNDEFEAHIDFRIEFINPLLKKITDDKEISEMLRNNEQLNADLFLKKIIRESVPDYDKKDNESTIQFIDDISNKFKKYYSHYFLQEVKEDDKAKTVYFIHLLQGIILNTKDLKKEFPIIRDFAAQADLKLSELINSIKNRNENVKKLEIFLKEHQNQIDEKFVSIDKNIKKLIAPQLEVPSIRNSKSPSNIFHYKYQYLYFVGRNKEISSLWNFLEDKEGDKKFMWWMIIGPGGMGKSRIAQRLCSMAKNYYAGFFEFKEDISLNPKWEFWEPEMPTLIVIDYALSKIDKVANLITILEQKSEKYVFPIRILLLDREATKEWAEKLIAYPLITDCLYRDQKKEENIELVLQPLEDDYTWMIVEQVIKKEAEIKWKKVEAQKEEILENLNELDDMHRPLFSFLSAMALAKEDNIRNWNTNELLEYTLASFEKLWWKNVNDRNSRELIKYILAANTFCGRLNACLSPLKDWTN